MTPAEVAALLEDIALRLQVQGADAFRVRAYQKAAQTLAAHTHWETLHPLPFSEKMRKLIALLAKGELPSFYTELKNQVPDATVELFRIRGLGPAKIHTLWKLNIHSVDQLHQALQRGKLDGLPGWGKKTLAALQAALTDYLQTRCAWTLPEAFNELNPLIAQLKANHIPYEITGQLRRWLPLLTKLELVVSPDAEKLFPNWLHPTPDMLQHPEKAIFLHLATPSNWGSVLFLTTGPPSFVEKLPLFPAETESQLFETWGLPYILPHWRDWHDILPLAQKRQLPQNLLHYENLKGLLHFHTTYSDGKNTLYQMVQAAAERGFTYAGVADHSAAAAYAGGLSPQKLYLQNQEIQKGDFPIPVFHGIEADILSTGEIDYTPAEWEMLDFIVASIHSKLDMSYEEATDRLLKALDNPYVKILGHWSGRILRARKGYDFDHEAVIHKCAEKGIAIELNCNPYRMDIDWQWARIAVAKGALLAINPDAHSIDEIDYLRWGVEVARKAGVSPSHVVNTFPPTWLTRQSSTKP